MMKNVISMTNVRRKKKFIFTVYGFLFLFGGMEYAVILPTLWLYLHNTYNAPEYMLGVVLSAYSVAAFFSAPIIGRVADRTGRTKEIFIFCASVQVIGSVLYFVGISEWLCVASRFICGIGGAGEAVALAEVSRHSTEGELTGIMSKMVAMRQIALLTAPGLNVVLRLANFKIGPFDINKYTVPGVFMAVLWILLIIIILTLYSEPRVVYSEEKKLKKLAERKKANGNADNHYDAIDPTSRVSENVYPNRIEKTSSSPPLCIDSKDNLSDNDMLQSDLGTSYDIMASAERLICSSELSGQQDGMHDQNVNSEPGDSWSLIDGEEAPLLKSTDVNCDSTKTDSNDILTTANDDYIDSHISYMDDLIAREGKLGFFCKEYIRDDVMAIITLLFCALFSQVALEAMCTPLSLEYMDFGELENSVLYCLCGVEIIIVFLIVSVLSKYVADRNMILFGGVLLLTANVLLIVFLPNAPRHSRVKNLPFVGLAVAMDVLSLPFLLVCATSLYSKMTRKETQGLSQGLRRGIVGLGTILAPMWASSIVEMPYLVLGVLIGIQSLSLSMCLLSYKRLKALEPETLKYASYTSKSTSVVKSRNSPTSNITNVPSSNATIPPSSQYGSIGSSVDSTAYRSSAADPKHQTHV